MCTPKMSIGCRAEPCSNINMRTAETQGPVRGIFAVLTDGMDNASRHSAADFHQLMAQVKAQFADVTCLFLAANIDAAAAADAFNFDRSSTMAMGSCPTSARAAFGSMTACCSRVATGQGAAGFTNQERVASAPVQSIQSRVSTAPASLSRCVR